MITKKLKGEMIMKKILAIVLCVVLAVSCLAVLSACGKQEGETAETERRMMINSEPVVITAKDGFDNAGVTELICDATETYSFTKSDDSTTWKVFVLDEKFADGARYLAQAQAPALEGDGTLTIEEGKYIYILCSESAFTGDSASEATLSIDYAGAD